MRLGRQLNSTRLSLRLSHRKTVDKKMAGDAKVSWILSDYGESRTDVDGFVDYIGSMALMIIAAFKGYNALVAADPPLTWLVRQQTMEHAWKVVPVPDPQEARAMAVSWEQTWFAGQLANTPRPPRPPPPVIAEAAVPRTAESVLAFLDAALPLPSERGAAVGRSFKLSLQQQQVGGLKATRLGGLGTPLSALRGGGVTKPAAGKTKMRIVDGRCVVVRDE